MSDGINKYEEEGWREEWIDEAISGIQGRGDRMRQAD